MGFPLIILPAYLVGGAKGVELFLAAIAALAMALAYRLALRVVPDPWAIGAAAVAGLSPPLLAYSTAIYPELTAGAALAGAALLALRLDERIRRLDAFLCFALLGLLPWLGTKFVPAGLAIGFIAARALWRSRRRTLAIGAVEVSLFSVALYVGINEALYGGVTPYDADNPGESATDASFPGGYANRAYRLVALFLDRNYGLLRWAPVFALAFAGLWWLWRSHREHLSRALTGVRDTELTAGLCAVALAAQLFVAAFLAPTMFGFWFPPRHLRGGPAAGRAARGPRAPALPEDRSRALRPDACERRLGLRRRALLRRRARDRAAGRPVRPAHRAAPGVQQRRTTGRSPWPGRSPAWPCSSSCARSATGATRAGATRARYSG